MIIIYLSLHPYVGLYLNQINIYDIMHLGEFLLLLI